MEQSVMRTAIGQIRNGVEQAINASRSPEDKVFAPLALAGIDLLGELLLDIKRIADASGSPQHLHFHCPEGAVLSAVGDTVQIEPSLQPPSCERVARFLADKEAARKFGNLAQLERNEWVNGNWQAFSKEAAELVAAIMSRPVPGTTGDK